LGLTEKKDGTMHDCSREEALLRDVARYEAEYKKLVDELVDEIDKLKSILIKRLEKAEIERHVREGDVSRAALFRVDQFRDAITEADLPPSTRKGRYRRNVP
jgi:hypothetical protein